MDDIALIKDLLSRNQEEEWFEFKRNYFDKDGIGKYISSISNGAALAGKKNGYLIWGIDDKTHEIVGSDFDYFLSVDGEPYQNYLARNLYPSIAFTFKEIYIEDKRVVILSVPAAKDCPVSFKRSRYGKIASSIVNLEKYPEREGLLWKRLLHGYPSMVEESSPLQDLHFTQLKAYYLSKGLQFDESNFKVNLHLVNQEGKYNMLACFLADDGDIPLRVSIFTGKTKSGKLFSVKEFGNQSLIYSIDKIIDYSDSINIVKSYENLHTGNRIDTPLFDQECFNEALKNAIIHNNWLSKTAPMITFYEDRIEIISFSSLAPNQTVEGFYLGHSIPVNEELSSIFLATHLSERSGKGNPLIVSRLGRQAFEIGENYIKVTIPFNWIKETERSVGYSALSSNSYVIRTSISRTDRIILRIIEDNPNIDQKGIAKIANLGSTTVTKSIANLKQFGYIKRVGANKNGYYEVTLDR